MVGELIAERYELEELIASGGMADVFRARDRLLDRTVAIKVLHDHHASDESFVERFRREAREAARLSHGNIVTVLDRGEENGTRAMLDSLGKRGTFVYQRPAVSHLVVRAARSTLARSPRVATRGLETLINGSG